MNDPVSVPLKACPYLTFFFWFQPASAPGAQTRLGMKNSPLDILCLLANRHGFNTPGLEKCNSMLLKYGQFHKCVIVINFMWYYFFDDRMIL